MFNHQNITIAAVAIFSVCSINFVQAATIAGKVLDRYGRAPTNGISGADVSLIDSNGKSQLETITNAKGGYSFKDVANGAYTIVVIHNSCVPRPHNSTKINVSSDLDAPDVKLIKSNEETAYYKAAAAMIAEAAVGDPQKTLAAEWDLVRLSNLSPSSRAEFAIQLNKALPNESNSIASMRPYIKANLADIIKIQTAFQASLENPEIMPKHGRVYNLDDQIVADIATHFVQSNEISQKNRNEFERSFLLTWDNSDATLKFNKWQLEKKELQSKFFPQKH